MRHLWAILVCALVVGCGGGGGGAPGGGSQTLQAIGQQVLEECGVDALNEYLALLAAFEALLDPNETNPPTFMIGAIDMAGGAVDWSLDLDTDGMPDLFGQLLFIDDQGAPFAPFDLNQLAAGFDQLDTFSSSMPDGSKMTFAASGAMFPQFDGAFTFNFQGAAVSTVEGDGMLQDTSCFATYTFSGESFQSVGGAFPAISITISFAGSTGTVEGTSALDGTNVARLDVMVDGDTAVFSYDVDLDTGDVTTVP